MDSLEISFLDMLARRPDPSLMGDKFEGRMLLHLFASCFTEDSYLRVQLTSQVSSPSFHPYTPTLSFHRISASLDASSALFSLVLASFVLLRAKIMSSRSFSKSATIALQLKVFQMIRRRKHLLLSQSSFEALNRHQLNPLPNLHPCHIY